MDYGVAEAFARAWYAAWNAHDLEGILSHYADDVEMASPLVSVLTGDADGRIVGKEALRAYFATGLERYPALHFEPLELFVGVSNLPASRRMYEAALAEIGFVVLSEGEFEGDSYVLFGRGDSDDFCLHTVGSKPGRDRVTTGAHIAFRASDAPSVARWHDAAVDHGGTDIGPPGVRPEYSGRYYAAFVLDPDGNNVEAVFHTPTDIVAEQ